MRLTDGPYVGEELTLAPGKSGTLEFIARGMRGRYQAIDGKIQWVPCAK